LDRFVCGRVFQFHRCCYYDFPKCTNANHIHPQNHIPFGLLCEKTLAQTAEFKQYCKPHNVYEMWECDWKQQYELTQNDFVLRKLSLSNY
jgi:ribulose-5-phosphate 4-epimerase/fuculose-1-phosphate aldolase